ncbi:hypothetical protein BJX64DRAFT_291762 [Aspergillus heterothallicus]
MKNQEDFATAVVIIGCGPTGAMLSVPLSQYKIPHVVLEQELEVVSEPRGIGLDEEGVHCVQACGIYDKIFFETGHSMEKFMFISGHKQDLSATPLWK